MEDDFIECPSCQGEGVLYDYDTDEVTGECPECDGAGGWMGDEE